MPSDAMHKTYELLRTDGSSTQDGTGTPPRSRGNRFVRAFLLSLVLLGAVVIVLDSFTPGGGYRWFSLGVNIVLTFFFSIEYILRLWTAPLRYPQKPPARARLRYALSPMGIVDLLTILPLYLVLLLPLNGFTLRVLAILRLFILFKANRYFKGLTTIGRVIHEKRHELFTSLAIVFSLMMISSAMIYVFEAPVQPDKFSNILSGMWWAVSTLLTIGYGDIYPVTAIGKLLAAVVAVLGVGLIAVPTGIVSAGFFDQLGKNDKNIKEDSALVALPLSGMPALHPAEEIRKYKELLDEGTLTQAEFDEKKRELLQKTSS